MVTSRIRSIPTEVALDERDGVPSASAINCDVLTTIAKDKLLRRIGPLSATRVTELHRALRFALAIPSGE